jgi:hypothetical protein
MSGSNRKDKIRKNKIAIYLKTFGSDSRYIDEKEKELRECIERLNRYHYLGEIVGVFRDFETTEFSTSLPSFKLLMNAVEQKQVTLVFIPEFRDLTFLTRDFLQLLSIFDRNGCGLRSANEYLLYERLED